MKLTIDKFAAVEVDLHDGSDMVTFRIWSGRANGRDLNRVVDGEIFRFELGLQIPFALNISISAEQYGTILRGNGSGNITFFVGDRNFNYINNFHWHGR